MQAIAAKLRISRCLEEDPDDNRPIELAS